MASVALATCAAVMSAITTGLPCRAKARAIPSPIPSPPPETRQTLPTSSGILSPGASGICPGVRRDPAGLIPAAPLLLRCPADVDTVAGRPGPEGTDGRLLLRYVLERVESEEVTGVAVGDEIDLVVGEAGILAMRKQQVRPVGPGAVRVREVHLPGNRLDADPPGKVERGRVVEQATEELPAEDLGGRALGQQVLHA